MRGTVRARDAKSVGENSKSINARKKHTGENEKRKRERQRVEIRKVRRKKGTEKEREVIEKKKGWRLLVNKCILCSPPFRANTICVY